MTNRDRNVVEGIVNQLTKLSESGKFSEAAELLRSLEPSQREEPLRFAINGGPTAGEKLDIRAADIYDACRQLVSPQEMIANRDARPVNRIFLGYARQEKFDVARAFLQNFAPEFQHAMMSHAIRSLSVHGSHKSATALFETCREDVPTQKLSTPWNGVSVSLLLASYAVQGKWGKTKELLGEVPFELQPRELSIAISQFAHKGENGAEVAAWLFESCRKVVSITDLIYEGGSGEAEVSLVLAAHTRRKRFESTASILNELEAPDRVAIMAGAVEILESWGEPNRETGLVR